MTGVAAGCGRPQEVAFGQDPDDLAVVGHDDGAGVGALHRLGDDDEGSSAVHVTAGEVIKSRTVVSIDFHYGALTLRL